VYVNPIETTTSLIQEGPVLKGRPARLLESANLEDIEGSWEQPIIERYLKELPAKQTNAQEALDQIRPLINGRGTFLDVGCFCGVFLDVAARNGWDCYGLDPLVMPAVYARGRFGLRVITDTLRDDTYPPEFFDVVTAFQVFEHIIEPARDLEIIRRILKPGGLVMIEVPNIETGLVKLLGSRHRHFVEDHVSFYSAGTLSRLLARMGFDTCKVYYPVRALSVQHLAWWMERYAHPALGRSAERVVSRLGLGSKTVTLSLRDIVTVIARKRADRAL
jgi:SAM-dependent methyltransferase